MIFINGFNAPLQFMDQAENLETQLTALKEALLSLLSQPDTWSSIELARVFRRDKESTKCEVKEPAIGVR